MTFAVCLLSGGVFALVTPPFQVPDEAAHFFRAYQISEGRFLARKAASVVGGELPESVRRVAWELTGDMPFHPEKKQPVAAIHARIQVPLAPSTKVFVSFPNTAVFGPVPYLPPAAAIFAGRSLLPSPLPLLYLGRFANLLAAALLMALAVAMTPVFRPVFFLLAATPMSLFLMGSLSGDAVTSALAFLLIASVLRCALANGQEMRPKSLSVLLISSLLLGFCKPGYALLSVAAWAIPSKKFRSPAHRVRFLGILAVASVGAALLWVFLVRELHAPDDPTMGLAPTEQWRFLQTRPFHFVGETFAYYIRLAPYFANQYIGKLGWVDTRLPVVVVVMHAAALLSVAATAGSRDHRIGWEQKGVFLFALLSTLLVVSVALFVYATPAGPREDFLYGAQGRYFIPLGPVAFLLLYNRRWIVEWGRYRAWLAGWVALVLSVALGSVAVRYYG